MHGRHPDPLLELIARLKLYAIEIGSLIGLIWLVYEGLRREIGL